MFVAGRGMGIKSQINVRENREGNPGTQVEDKQSGRTQHTTEN
jgi:hypothetical protein